MSYGYLNPNHTILYRHKIRTSEKSISIHRTMINGEDKKILRRHPLTHNTTLKHLTKHSRLAGYTNTRHEPTLCYFCPITHNTH